jgi:hypothetical protein
VPLLRRRRTDMLVKEEKMQEWEEQLRLMQEDVDSGNVSDTSHALKSLQSDIEWERTRFSRAQR